MGFYSGCFARTLGEIRSAEPADCASSAPRFVGRLRSCWQQELVVNVLPTGRAPASEAHTNCQQRFILPARRYEARSIALAVCRRSATLDRALADGTSPDSDAALALRAQALIGQPPIAR
jgi:hypothetical protein